MDYSTTLKDKIREINASIDVLKNNESLSKNTKQTQGYKLRRDRDVLHLIEELVRGRENVQLSESAMNTFILITTLASERPERTVVTVKEGDNIQDKLEEYKDVKSVYDKLVKAADKANLKMDFSVGKFVPKA